MLGSLDGYSGADPTSPLFIETYLAATRDEVLKNELTGLLGEFRSRLATWLGQHGDGDPAQTAAGFAAAIDGVMLHRALDPGLTSATVSPALRRLIATADPDLRRDT